VSDLRGKQEEQSQGEEVQAEEQPAGWVLPRERSKQSNAGTEHSSVEI